MAEEVEVPAVIPGMVSVEFIGNSDSGERKGTVKNVFPIDAKELVATGEYKLYENGAVEIARLNPVPLRAKPAKATEVKEAEAPAPEVKETPAPPAATTSGIIKK